MLARSISIRAAPSSTGAWRNSIYRREIRPAPLCIRRKRTSSRKAKGRTGVPLDRPFRSDGPSGPDAVQPPGKPGVAAQGVEGRIHLEVNQTGGPVVESRLQRLEEKDSRPAAQCHENGNRDCTRFAA